MHNRRLLAFLDSNVLIEYIRGEGASANLFHKSVRERVRYASNAIALQELFAIAEVQRTPNLLVQLERLIEVLPLDIARTDRWFKRASELRDEMVHSNDLLILSSAEECDFLLSYDRDLLVLARTKQKPQVITPDEFLLNVVRDSSK
jgi:predicted nucleic acid-binding protein